MTLAVESAVERYVGDGATTSYDYRFKIFDETDLLVITADTSGVESTLTYQTDYTVEGARDDDGGYITLTSALADSYEMVIKRVRPLTQEADIKNNGEYYPVTHENALDHLVMIAQQMREELDRCIVVSPFETSSFDPSLPAGAFDHSDSCLMVNDSGTGLTWGPSASELAAAGAAAEIAEAAASEAASSAMDASGFYASALELVSTVEGYRDTCTDIYAEIGFLVTDVQTGSYAATSYAEVVLVDPTAASLTVDLPATATNIRKIVKNVSSSLNIVTIATSGTATIDDESSYELSGPYASLSLISNGTDWMIVSWV